MPFDPMYFYGTYRVPSARKPGRDYTSGSYFITICTHERRPWFGRIRDGRVGLALPGMIAQHFWRSISRIHPCVTVDAYIVMPNHTHGILTLGNDESRVTVETGQWPVSTPPRETTSRLIPGSVGSIVNQYKSACTKMIRTLGYTDFAWQPNYYDRIIRDADAMESVRTYIKNNPVKWWKKHHPNPLYHTP